MEAYAGQNLDIIRKMKHQNADLLIKFSKSQALLAEAIELLKYDVNIRLEDSPDKKEFINKATLS